MNLQSNLCIIITILLLAPLHAKESAAALTSESVDLRGDIALDAFEEKNLSGWTTSGAAFQPAPDRSVSKHVTAFAGAGIAWSGQGGVEAIGNLLSPEFAIQRVFINYRVAGARDLPAKLGVELLVDGKVVRAASASEAKDPSRALYWRTWDVRELIGRTARIRVNDQSKTGSIAVGSFAQSDTLKGVPVDARMLGRESLRPQFHYTALTGWLNDANGLLHYQGQWHLFHQYQPPDDAKRVWGHAVSSDLLHWQRLPVAIAAAAEDSAASGSGLVDWANISGLKRGDDPPVLLFYTQMPPSNSGRKGTQCLVFSTDGARTFELFPGNPILRTPATRDRDPKVFFYPPTRTWIMALSLSRNNTDRDHATYGLFRSKDLNSWELFQELGPGAWYWECPDMFELPVDGNPKRTKWVFMKGSGDYIIGTFDGQRFTPEAGPIRTHWGGNFYGAQTFSDAPGGRRVQIAWMSTGKEGGPNSWPGMPFNQQMSFPRELTLRATPEGPRLFREPVAEIAQLYTKQHEQKSRTLNPGDNALAGISSDLLDIALEIELRAATQVKLNLRGEEILYDTKAQKLKAFGRALALTPVNSRLMLRALLDRTSIELFANHGEVTFAGVYFPAASNHILALTVEGGAAHINKLSVHELKSVWNAVSTPAP